MYFVWYDDNPKKPVSAKIDEAVLRYKQKFGTNPSICKLSEKIQPQDLQLKEDTVAGVKVQTAKNIPQNYFWIGNEV
jgi:hypothetical protein